MLRHLARNYGPAPTRRLGRSAYVTAAACVTTAAVALGLVGCGGGAPAAGAAGGKALSPITVGTSLSLSGDFATDGKAFVQGYKLWAAYQNAHGGLLGHPIKLQILNDNSSPTQVVTNYQALITKFRDPLVLGDFSTLLASPAESVAHRFGYALIDGAGAGSSAFQRKFNDYFNTGAVVSAQLLPFAHYLAGLPASSRPKTVAFATADDPFILPMLPPAQKILTAAGIKTVYYKVFPLEATDFTPIADAVIAQHPTAVILGDEGDSTDAPFWTAFETAHFNPKVLLAVNGPTTGTAFTKAVGTTNANGVFAPGQWYPGTTNSLSKAMLKEYLAKYGGSATKVNSDIAQAYSAGEVLAAAVKGSHSLSNAKIISWLHKGKVIATVQGPAKFNSIGETFGGTFIFQWQGGKYMQVLPPGAGSTKPLYPKSNWK
ncbi:MAG: amino acid ABC transporter substrate-binding protein [Acidimicrobiales bacterium]